MGRLLLCLLLCGLLAACDMISTMKEGLQQSQDMAAELEKTTGAKAFVGFNWNDGKLNAIQVTFEGAPTKPFAEIAEHARAAAKKHFKQIPEQLVLAFSIGPNP